MPTLPQAADYSATWHYLSAVKAAGTRDSETVMARMRATPVDDFFARGYIRPDGRMVHDMYLMQVKTPAESRYAWDYYKVIETIPAEAAAATKAEGRCGHEGRESLRALAMMGRLRRDRGGSRLMVSGMRPFGR